MTSNKNVSAPMIVSRPKDEITVSVRELLLGGAMLSEVMVVLRETCFLPKGIIVIKKADMWCVYAGRATSSNQVFTSPSLAPCVEFALKYEEPHD